MNNQLQRFSFFLAIFVCLATSLRAQSDDLEQLKFRLQKAGEDTTRVNLLLQVSRLITDTDERLYYARRAAKLSEELGFNSGLGRAKLAIGRSYLDQQHIAEAKAEISEALALFKRTYNTHEECASDLYMGKVHKQLQHLDSALYYFEHSLLLATEIGYSEMAAEAYFESGCLYAHRGNNIKALQRLNKSLDYYLSRDEKSKLWLIYNQIGVLYEATGRYPDALSAYISALEIAVELDDNQAQINILKNIASFYYQIGKLEESLKYYDEILELSMRAERPKEQWLLLNNKAQIHAELEDTVSALLNLKVAYDMASKMDECALAYVLDGIANIMMGQGDIDSAKINYTKARGIAQTCQNQLLLAKLTRGLGETNIRQLNFKHGEVLLLQSLDICEKSNYSREKEKTTYELYQFYKNKGVTPKALAYFEMYNQTREQLFNTDANMEISRISSEYEFRKELHKMEYQKKAEELKLMAELDKESSNKNVLLLVLILTVLLAATLVRSYFLLQSHNHRLETLNEEKNTLMGVVAHDLRSPLNNIKGIIGLMKSEENFARTTKENQDYIRLLSESANHMRDMIDKALDINAIEEMRLNLSLQRFDVGKILKSVSAGFSALASKKNIAIHEEFSIGEFYINVDKNYIIQVFDNLLSNAIKFSERDKNIYINVNQQDGFVNIRIQDEGPGLSDTDRSKLFTKYQKLAAKPTGDEQSIGLGLSIVKKFVDAMKGEITCESILGGGSTFIVKFEAA